MSSIKEKINVEEILQLNQQGLNQQEIAIELGIHPKAFAYWVDKLKIPIQKRHKYFVNDHFWDIIDTEEKAYLLGYFIADGCLCLENKKHKGVIDSHSKRLGFCVSIDDYEVVELIRKCIVPSKIIEHTNNQSGVKYYRKPQLRIRWISNYMFDKLVSYGIKPRKTYDNKFKLPEGLIPAELMRHFIRGYFDGDGTKSQCALQFCVNSKYFAEQIGDFFKPFKYKIYEKQGKTCVYYILQINGGKKLFKQVIKDFYDNAHYYLTRKFNKFMQVK